MGRRALRALVAAIVTIGGSAACNGAHQGGAAVVCGGRLTPATSLPSFTAAPPPSLAAGASWDAVISTTCGDIVVRLDGAAAPRAVASFVQLAQSGYWTNSGCSRLTARMAPSRLLQCGDSLSRVPATPGYDLSAENAPTGHRYVRGSVGMVTVGFDGARAGEFFIVHEDFTAAPEAMPEPAMVGHVLSGMTIVETIASEGVEDGQSDWHPFQGIDVRSVTVNRSGS